MAPKVPRVPYGDRPSAVPGGPVSAASEGAQIASAVGGLFDVGQKIATDAAQTAAENERAAREAKQAIVNEVDAGRRTGDFEEDLVEQATTLKNDFADNPGDAPNELLTRARVLADRLISGAPNTAVGLELAQRTGARIDSAMREMHNWAVGRQTQKAKNDLDVIINRAAAGAESKISLGALAGYIEDKEAELAPMFRNVLGSEAGAKMKELRTSMTRAWFNVFSSKHPYEAADAIVAEAGPLVDYLNDTQREAARNDVKASAEGLTKQREFEAIQTGIRRGGELADAFLAGDPQFAGIVFSEREALKEQRNAVKAGIAADSKILAKIGVQQGDGPDEILKIIDEREKFVNALDKARRRQISFNVPDDPASVDALMVQMTKALKSPTGKKMASIVTLRKDLAVALMDERVSGATAATMFKTMSLAVQPAIKSQEGLWDLGPLNEFREPLNYGVLELNRQLEGSYKGFTPAQKAAIRVRYHEQFNAASEAGETVNLNRAKEMALRSIALEGKPVPGIK